MAHSSSRREFLQRAALTTPALAGSLALFDRLPRVTADEASLRPQIVRFDQSIEPLVRLIEDTSRDQLLERVAERIRTGTSYREVLASLLLAGIRNVQPRPSVGFKFHCVLVVNSCHLASLAGPDSDRWLPLFWGLDYFKSSQADEKQRSGWRMQPVATDRIPDASAARAEFVAAMDSWDAARADTAVVGITRALGATEVFNLFAQYAARDYRSIGHKAIYLANAWRTLQVIGWEFAEPVLRSLAFALLNHSGEPNPATSELAADQPWRENGQLREKIDSNWLNGQLDRSATQTLMATMRESTPVEASREAVAILNRGIGPQSIWDAVFVRAGELLMQQPGIIGLHGLTTANAMHYLWSQVADPALRQRMLLQACSFNPMFRDSAKGRGRVGQTTVEQLDPVTPEGDRQAAIQDILKDISGNRLRAAAKLRHYLEHGGDGEAFITASRRVLFHKGRDAHDYKFSSAVLEDFAHVSPEWRNQFLALAVFNLRGTADRDTGIVARTRSALS